TTIPSTVASWFPSMARSRRRPISAGCTGVRNIRPTDPSIRRSKKFSNRWRPFTTAATQSQLLARSRDRGRSRGIPETAGPANYRCPRAGGSNGGTPAPSRGVLRLPPISRARGWRFTHPSNMGASMCLPIVVVCNSQRHSLGVRNRSYIDYDPGQCRAAVGDTDAGQTGRERTVLEPSGDQSYPGDLADMPGALFSEFEGTVKRAASGTTRSRLELAVIGAALLTVPVTFLQLSGHSAPWLTVADWAIGFVFGADYPHAVSAAPDRRTAACRHWISAVVVVLSFPILPHVLAFTRLTRLSRLVRLARLVRLIVATSRGLQGV